MRSPQIVKSQWCSVRMAAPLLGVLPLSDHIIRRVLRSVLGKDEKQAEPYKCKNPERKASIEYSISQVHLAEATIKNSAVLEMMEGVVDTVAFAAKAGVDEMIATSRILQRWTPSQS